MDKLQHERDRLQTSLALLEGDRCRAVAQCGRYRALHERAKERETELRKKLDSLEAENKRLKRDLYGRKSEASAKNEHANKPASKRRRGQQPGNTTPARRTHPDLAIIPEAADVPPAERQCPACSQALTPLPFDNTTSVIEVHVQAYVRKITKKCYRPTCTCGVLPGVVSPATVGAVLPGSNLGVTAIAELMMAKFRSGQPIYRLLQNWRSLGLDLPLGTVYGLQDPLMRLFEPIYDLIGQRNRDSDHWHIDETRWMVLVKVPDKQNYNWWMWTFVTTDTVYFTVSPTRSADVVTGHLGNQPVGIASVDRYSVYKAIAARALAFLLAFCWAHARRDFTTLAATVPGCMEDALVWVSRIGALYQANKKRMAVWDKPRSAAYRDADTALHESLTRFEQQVDAALARTDVHTQLRPALVSLFTHREGLRLFVDHPEIPMDNNQAENSLRPQVIIRKNSFFNGSAATARFHVIMTSLIATLERNGINSRTWMLDYLQHCALAGGRPPPDTERFLPWNASEKDLKRWTAPDPPRPWPGHDTCYARD
jgi:transposase